MPHYDQGPRRKVSLSTFFYLAPFAGLDIMEFLDRDAFPERNMAPAQDQRQEKPLADGRRACEHR